MSQLVTPHGSAAVKPLLASPTARAEGLERAERLRRIPLDSRAVSDVLTLGMGAYTPLDGFMGYDDWRGARVDMKLTNGLLWPIPITLPVGHDVAEGIQPQEQVALIESQSGEILAIMEVREKYSIFRPIEAERVYGTTDATHPGVAKVMSQGEVNLAGRVLVLSEGQYPRRYPGLYIRPVEARTLFREQGWSRVAAFQTRNPMHRSHEYLVKITLEVLDGAFIHQVLGKPKPADVPAEVRTRAVQALVDNHFRAGTVVYYRNGRSGQTGPAA